MSDSYPPLGPPPSGPPPLGPPPSAPPSSGAPAGAEILDSSGRGGYPPPPAPPSGGPGAGKGRGLRAAIIAGGALVGLAAVGTGAFFGYQAFFGTGAQPAEALPAGTIGYVSVDLDPSGSQKLEALKTLRKFPAFADNVGLNTGDDLRQKLFELAQDDGACPDLDFDADVKPWLGNRFAFAGVPLSEKDDDGNATVAPVFVMQVTDADKADAGLQKLADCVDAEEPLATVPGSASAPSASATPTTVTPSADTTSDASSNDFGGWSFTGDWVVIAETKDIATEVTQDAADGSLADDGDFKKWTGEAGDPGIISAYASPDSADYLVKAIESADPFALGGGLDYACSSSVVPDPYPTPDSSGGSDGSGNDFGDYTDPYTSTCDDQSLPAPDTSDETKQLEAYFDGFDGAALTVRFNDGSLEVESATSQTSATSNLSKVTSTDNGGEVVETLPADTAVAYGVGFDAGWFTQLTDYFSSLAGTDLGVGGDVSSMIDEAEQATGLSLPEDAETLAGESAAVSVGNDFPSFDSIKSPADVPVAVKVKGDPDAINGVLDKLKNSPDIAGEDMGVFDSSVDGDTIAVGPDSAYRDEVAMDGDLGSQDAYRSVVPHSSDASQVFYVNFDNSSSLVQGYADLFSGFGESYAGSGDSSADDPMQGVLDEVKANLEPLQALGISTWSDGDVTHGMLKITTN